MKFGWGLGYCRGIPVHILEQLLSPFDGGADEDSLDPLCHLSPDSLGSGNCLLGLEEVSGQLKRKSSDVNDWRRPQAATDCVGRMACAKLIKIWFWGCACGLWLCLLQATSEKLTSGIQKRLHSKECTRELCAGNVTMCGPCASVQVVPYIKGDLLWCIVELKGVKWHVSFETWL